MALLMVLWIKCLEQREEMKCLEQREELKCLDKGTEVSGAKGRSHTGA